jgi:hypothetical protein
MVSLATIVCAPWASPLGVKVQFPDPSAVVVPITCAPSVSVTRALASPPPCRAGLAVMAYAEGPFDAQHHLIVKIIQIVYLLLVSD